MCFLSDLIWCFQKSYPANRVDQRPHRQSRSSLNAGNVATAAAIVTAAPAGATAAASPPMTVSVNLNL